MVAFVRSCRRLRLKRTTRERCLHSGMLFCVSIDSKDLVWARPERMFLSEWVPLGTSPCFISKVLPSSLHVQVKDVFAKYPQEAVEALQKGR